MLPLNSMSVYVHFKVLKKHQSVWQMQNDSLRVHRRMAVCAQTGGFEIQQLGINSKII